MSWIKDVIARQIFDSRGNPTVECDIVTQQGTFRAAVPSGASTGIHEAIELRDGEKAYHGKGVLKAIEHINKIIKPKILGKSVKHQEKIDELLLELDGTKNKSNLGANAILAVSMAVCKAGAAALQVPLWEYISLLAQTTPSLPVPCMNIINGGQHAKNNLDVQEFMIVPHGAKSFSQAMQMGTEIYQTLKTLVVTEYKQSGVGDEGGFAPPMKSSDDALKFITKAIKQCGYDKQVGIALDAAASEFYKEGKYNYEKQKLSGAQLAQKYKAMIKKYPIISIEDPFDQDDFVSYAKLLKDVKKTTQIVGDDLLVTNVERIKLAIEQQACNTLLLKVNQIGSITEAINAAKLAKEQKWNVMVSHRSGETEDTFIADLVVGLGVGQIKSGAPCRSERVAKYNQLLRIEESASSLKYMGKKAFR